MLLLAARSRFRRVAFHPETRQTHPRGIPWPLFVLLLVANGWFVRARLFLYLPDGPTANRRARSAMVRVAFFLAGWGAAFATLPTLWVGAAPRPGWPGSFRASASLTTSPRTNPPPSLQSPLRRPAPKEDLDEDLGSSLDARIKPAARHPRQCRSQSEPAPFAPPRECRWRPRPGR